MKKAFLVLTMAMFIGSMGVTVYAMNNTNITEIVKGEDDKKKKKKGEAKACCADKTASEAPAKTCSSEAKTEGAKCCASKAAAEKQ